MTTRVDGNVQVKNVRFPEEEEAFKQIYRFEDFAREWGPPPYLSKADSPDEEALHSVPCYLTWGSAQLKYPLGLGAPEDNTLEAVHRMACGWANKVKEDCEDLLYGESLKEVLYGHTAPIRSLTSTLEPQRALSQIVPVPRPSPFKTVAICVAGAIATAGAIYKFVPNILKTSVCKYSVTIPGFLGGKTVQAICGPTALGRLVNSVSEHAPILLGAIAVAATTLYAIKKFGHVNKLPEKAPNSTPHFRKPVFLLTDAPRASKVNVGPTLAPTLPADIEEIPTRGLHSMEEIGDAERLGKVIDSMIQNLSDDHSGYSPNIDEALSKRNLSHRTTLLESLEKAR